MPGSNKSTQTTPKANGVIAFGNFDVVIDGRSTLMKAVHGIFNTPTGSSVLPKLDPDFPKPDEGEYIAFRVQYGLWAYVDESGKTNVVSLGDDSATFPWMFLGGAQHDCVVDGELRTIYIDAAKYGAYHLVLTPEALREVYETLRAMIKVTASEEHNLTKARFSLKLHRVA